MLARQRAMQPPPSEGGAPARRRSGLAARLLDWRLPPIETYPSVVAFAQTIAGRLALFALFAGMMKLVARGMWTETGGLWLVLTIAAAWVSLAGRHRHRVLLACTAMLLAYAPGWFNYGAVSSMIQQENVAGSVHPWYLRSGTLMACVPLAAIAIYLARRYRGHALGRRPVLAQHVLYLCLLGLAASHLLHGLQQVLLWSMTATFSAYFWYLAYALMDQRHREPAPGLLQFATFNPFAWSALVPMGKGAANWRSVEAVTAEELAVTQLKALKLLVWAFVLKLVLWLFRTIVYGKLGVPPLDAAFERFLRGGDVPMPYGLFSVVANFPEQLLIMALWGHVIIATARLAGFRLLRNTCRPLASRTIAEFWNRYYYYFKELMVDVYFYPAYVRWFKRHPRLRLAFATFMAAGVGNFFFHFIRDNQVVAKFGLLEAVIRAQTYAFYCAVLVAGIVVSQLRVRQPDAGAGWWRGRCVPALGVALFFCFLSFFDGPYRHVTLTQHFAFLFKVFGLDRWMQTFG
jgi:hypothetical protein